MMRDTATLGDLWVDEEVSRNKEEGETGKTSADLTCLAMGLRRSCRLFSAR